LFHVAGGGDIVHSRGSRLRGDRRVRVPFSPQDALSAAEKILLDNEGRRGERKDGGCGEEKKRGAKASPINHDLWVKNIRGR